MKRRASFCFNTCVCKYKSKKYYCWHSFTMATHLPWLFALRISHGYLPWEFAAAICRGYLPWEFAVTICHGFFVYVSKSFLVYVSKSCLYGSKPFLDASKCFLFVKYSLLMVSPFKSIWLQFTNEKHYF